jgi:hypothetical protein
MAARTVSRAGFQKNQAGISHTSPGASRKEGGGKRRADTAANNTEAMHTSALALRAAASGGTWMRSRKPEPLI